MIHTDAGILGANVPTGDVDFWLVSPNVKAAKKFVSKFCRPNGGILQPGCSLTEEPLCDHSRSWRYFAESVASDQMRFDSLKCDSYENFKKLNCSKKALMNNMGIDAAKK